MMKFEARRAERVIRYRINKRVTNYIKTKFFYKVIPSRYKHEIFTPY